MINISNGSGRAGMLAVAAEKELASEIAAFEAALYRRDDVDMEIHRERARAVLDTILDLKAQAFVLACQENGLR